MTIKDNPKSRLAHVEYTLTGSQNKRVHGLMVKAITSLIKPLVEDVNQGSLKILEVGCGRGEILASIQTLPGIDASGVDVDPVCVEISSQYVPCALGKIEDLGELYQPGAFDLVIASHVLEHIQDPSLALQKIAWLTKDYILVAVPNPVRPSRLVKYLTGRIAPDHITHRQVWDPGHFANYIEHVGGLRILKWQPDIVTIFPAKLYSLPIIGPTITKLFDFIEVRLLTRFFPYFSSSLIILATKDNESPSV